MAFYLVRILKLVSQQFIIFDARNKIRDKYLSAATDLCGKIEAVLAKDQLMLCWKHKTSFVGVLDCQVKHRPLDTNRAS